MKQLWVSGTSGAERVLRQRGCSFAPPCKPALLKVPTRARTTDSHDPVLFVSVMSPAARPQRAPAAKLPMVEMLFATQRTWGHF